MSNFVEIKLLEDQKSFKLQHCEGLSLRQSKIQLSVYYLNEISSILKKIKLNSYCKKSPKSSIHFVLQRLFYSVNVLLPRLYKNYSVDPITFRYSLSNVFAVTNLTEEIQLETAIDTTELIISCLLTLVDFEANQKEVNDLEVRRGLDSLTNGFEYVLKSVVPRLIKDFSIENI